MFKQVKFTWNYKENVETDECMNIDVHAAKAKIEVMAKRIEKESKKLCLFGEERNDCT